MKRSLPYELRADTPYLDLSRAARGALVARQVRRWFGWPARNRFGVGGGGRPSYLELTPARRRAFIAAQIKRRSEPRAN